MKMVFIGLDVGGIARLGFEVMKLFYNGAGGPSFAIEEFKPQEGNETNSIAELLETRAMALVGQTVAQTCACPVGHGSTIPLTTSTAPTPPVTPGPDVLVPPHVQAIVSGYTDWAYVDKGVQGSVYSATSDSKRVAIKHMLFDTADARQYFTREVTSLRALVHPAIISYIESRDLSTEAVLVTRFEPNGTLETFLKCAPVGDLDSAYQTKKTIIAFGLAFTMEYIHKRGYTHRDLKAANVFLNENFEPVIGDFGLATDFPAQDGSVGPTMVIGTPLHMAPELWLDASDGYGQPVDVYAYAVLLYTLFVSEPLALLNDGKGKPKNVSTLMKRIGEEGARFQRVPAINDHYWELITSAWQAAPQDRPPFRQIVDGMTSAVSAFLFPGADEAAVRRYVATMQGCR